MNSLKLQWLRAWAIGVVIYLTAIGSPVQAESILTLDQVLALFYQQNLELIAAQYNIDAARADEVVAGAIPNPEFSVQIAEMGNRPNMGSSARGCNHDATVSCGPATYFSFSQLLDLAGKRGLRMESSGFAAQAAEADLRDAVRIFSNLVRDAYYDVLLAQKNQWLAEEVVKHYQDITRANQLRLNVGDIAQADFLRVKTEAARAQTDLDMAQASLQQARASLAQVLRWSTPDLTFAVAEEWPSIAEPLVAEDSLIERAMSQRPDLQADQQRAEQAKKELELARRLQYPDVTVNAGYARDPSNNSLNSFFVGVSVPVPLFYQYQGESDKATAGLNQAQLDVEQTALTIRKEVVSASAAWKSADQMTKRYQNGLLDDAKTIRDSAELAYAKGASGVLDFIDAQRSYKAVMRDYFAALVNRANAHYDLQKALGTDSTALAPQSAGVVRVPR